MKKCIPDRNWLRLQESIARGNPPKNEMSRRVYSVLVDGVEDEAVEYLLELKENAYKFETVLAFFMSGALIPIIAESLELDEEVLHLYQHLFINPKEFKSKLDRLYYAKELVQEISQSSEGAALVQAAILMGPKFLVWHLSSGEEEVQLDPKALARRMIHGAFFTSGIAKGNSITSEESKEALKWLKTAATLISSYDKLRIDDTATDDAMLAIEQRKATLTAEEAGISIEDILN